MQLSQKLSSFWQRLTRIQRLSLISILFFLVVLPVGIWLTLSPTSPFSRAGQGPITSPISGPFPSIPPPPSLAPTAEVTGPASGRAGEPIGPYTVTARGIELTGVSLFWSSGALNDVIASNVNCNKSNFCTASGSFTPQTGGTYYVFAIAHSTFESCTGVPPGVPNPGVGSIKAVQPLGGGGPLPDCGQNSRITVSVTNPAITQTFNWFSGYNFVGITVDKPNYKAADFLRDTNSTFVTTPPRPFAKIQGGGDILSVVYRFNQTTYNWEYYTSWEVGNNFVMRPGEGYVVKSTQEGASSIQGAGSETASIEIGSRWSLIGLDTTRFATAETLLQAMQGQGIDARVLAKWNPQSGRYELKQTGVDAGDFPILPGAGYWVRNNGDAKTFNLP